jgi:pimeloyl-ACP methyl ester carboxylesterase
MQTSRLETLQIRGASIRVRHWGAEDAAPVFLLHGWLDCSATFQFIVDELPPAWHLIAPDWRGHGGSHRTGEAYAFLQYIADLDALFEFFSPAEAVRIVGHSLGGNTSSLYAGARPERVRWLVNLEGLAPVPGLFPGSPVERLSKWLSKLSQGIVGRSYSTHDEMAHRLRAANPRLGAARADFLAREFSARQPDGRFAFDYDPYQQAGMPLFGHEQLVESTWPRITARVLLVTAADSDVTRYFAKAPGALARRLALIKNLEHVELEDAGHNLHHDQPREVAALIERFASSA